MGRTRILAGLGVAALVLVVQAAWGTIPSPRGAIHAGCYQKSTGALRVVNSSIGCNLGTEGVLQWNDGPVPLNVSVPMSTPTNFDPVTVYSNHGLMIQYQCWLKSGGGFGAFVFDSGSTGQNTLSMTVQEFTFPRPFSYLYTSNPIYVGAGSGGGLYHAVGTYVAQTSQTVVTVVFAITIDFTGQTCNLAGTITPGR